MKQIQKVLNESLMALFPKIQIYQSENKITYPFDAKTIFESYRDQNRFFHNLVHIKECLKNLELFKGYHQQNKDFVDNFAFFPSNHLSLVRKDGALDLYHGVLRAVDKDGKKILNDVDYQE
jgi:coenzyme F420-reducing hydrogenase alpha subunit